MKLLSVKKSKKDGKKLVAEFCECNGESKCKSTERKNIHFGSDVSTTYSEGASKDKRDAYIKRHRVNEDWTKVNAGSLSRYVLWEKPSIKAGIEEFKKRFKC